MYVCVCEEGLTGVCVCVKTRFDWCICNIFCSRMFEREWHSGDEAIFTRKSKQ